MARQVIVPLDKSHISECAIPYARALSRRMSVPIKLLAVVESSRSLPDRPAGGDLAPVEESRPASPERRFSASQPVGMNPGGIELTEDEVDALSNQLSETERYLTSVGERITEIQVDKMVVYGDPVDQIVKAGQEVDGRSEAPPVIVMASHGRSGLGRMLLGSVALKVAQRATCPVIVVRALPSAVPDADELSFRKAVIALDGSDFSEAAIEPVRNVLGHEGTSLHLLRVVTLNRSWVTGEPGEQDAEGRTARDAAEQYLSRLAERLTGRGYSVTWDVVEGDPAERINSVAEDVEADMIALATHGYSGLKRLTIGSVAEEVLNNAVRPIILVRPDDS